MTPRSPTKMRLLNIAESKHSCSTIMSIWKHRVCGTGTASRMQDRDAEALNDAGNCESTYTLLDTETSNWSITLEQLWEPSDIGLSHEPLSICSPPVCTLICSAGDNYRSLKSWTMGVWELNVIVFGLWPHVKRGYWFFMKSIYIRHHPHVEKSKVPSLHTLKVSAGIYRIARSQYSLCDFRMSTSGSLLTGILLATGMRAYARLNVPWSFSQTELDRVLIYRRCDAWQPVLWSLRDHYITHPATLKDALQPGLSPRM
jgi:hypothetical protein